MPLLGSSPNGCVREIKVGRFWIWGSQTKASSKNKTHVYLVFLHCVETNWNISTSNRCSCLHLIDFLLQAFKTKALFCTDKPTNKKTYQSIPSRFVRQTCQMYTASKDQVQLNSSCIWPHPPQHTCLLTQQRVTAPSQNLITLLLIGTQFRDDHREKHRQYFEWRSIPAWFFHLLLYRHFVFRKVFKYTCEPPAGDSLSTCGCWCGSSKCGWSLRWCVICTRIHLHWRTTVENLLDPLKDHL